MNRNTLSYLAFGVALALFLTYFWRARSVRRDASPVGPEADRVRKRKLNWILAAAFLALAAAALL